MQRWVVAISTALVLATVTFTLRKFASDATDFDLKSKEQRVVYTRNISLPYPSTKYGSIGRDTNSGVTVLKFMKNSEYFVGHCDIVRESLGLYSTPPNLLVEISECSSSRHGNLLSGIFMTKLLALSVNGTYTYRCGGGGGDDHSNLLHQLAPILSNKSSSIPVLVNFTDVCTECALDVSSSQYVHVCPYGLNWAAPIIQQDLQTWAWKHRSEITDLDDVAIHFRCGDVLTYGSNFMGFTAFDTYTSMLGSKYNPNMHSIGIVTSSLEPSHCRSENCDYDHLEDCRIILQGLVDFLEGFHPGVQVHIRNSVNETLGTAFLRLVLANVTLCPAPSTFCLYPTMASVGQGHILYKAELNPFIENIDTVSLFPNIHVYKDPILTTDEIKTWKNQTGAAIVEWQRGHKNT